MINVYTVLSQSFNHTKEYVYRLKRSLERNATVKFRFVCLTNEQLPGIETVPTQEIGRWAKMELCHPLVKGRIHYIDLDTVITGNIDFFLSTDASLLCRNPLQERRTAIMTLNENERSLVWDFWSSDRERIIGNFKGEGSVYNFSLPGDIPCIQEVFPGRVTSFSKEDTGLPVGSKMVTFSGGLYPKDLEEDSWMKKYW